jgi:hypothetical protein
MQSRLSAGASRSFRNREITCAIIGNEAETVLIES